MSQEYSDSVDLVNAGTVAYLSGAVLIAALTAVLAQFSIDLPGGVPFSFQPFGVFFAGVLLGPIWGGFSMLLYLLVGIAGAPVFSNGTAGVGIVLGPTGGFLISYVFAAAAIGLVAHRSLDPVGVDDLPAVGVTAGPSGSVVCPVSESPRPGSCISKASRSGRNRSSRTVTVRSP